MRLMPLLGLSKQWGFSERKIRRKVLWDTPNWYCGNEMDYWFRPREEINVESRVRSHFKNCQRQPSQLEYLYNMQQFCDEHGIELFVVIPPVTEKYKAFLPEAVSPMGMIEHNHALKIIDFWNDSDFVLSDFGDYDHLNVVGAEKLTAKIRQYFG